MIFERKRCVSRFFPIFFAVLSLHAGSVRAEEQGPSLELANAPGFTERYAGNTQVNGQFISGLAYAGKTTSGVFSDLRIGLLRDVAAAPSMLCIRVVTDDGRYWAANMYRANGAFDVPPKVPISTKYAEQLDMYGADSVLMLATLAGNCNEAIGKVYVPGIIGGKSPEPMLVAYVNVSQSKVLASLQAEDKSLVEKGKCRKPTGGPRVTYSHVCEIPVPGSMRGKRVELVVGVKGLTGKATEQRYAVHVE
ncbi:hypothetical protein [Rhizobium sp. Root483D2]|uniref:hypothetical protein n=1 Tax=Rhizobium sp. Root483D2 TaxID=1736545 RepID=UPI000714AF4C|nr:hypothetical protein [Rhizobium sp. Root483D2]KQY25927.1 hypothetical protein ASD32_25950 [Rhizobium sp. Root483D2]